VGTGKINLSKPTFLILFLVVAGIGLTIGAASAVMIFTENLRVDNGAGDSEVEITSATGNSKLTLTDQGKKEFAIVIKDDKKKLLIKDVSKGKIRLQLTNKGDFRVNEGMSVDGNTLFVNSKNDRVGIGTTSPTSTLHVVGDFTLESSILCTGCIDTTDIADGSILTEDLAPSSIQVYEVSAVSFIPAGGSNTLGNPVQLRCLDGDWFLEDDNDPQKSVVMSTNQPALEGAGIDIVAFGSLIQEDEPGIANDFKKTIGFDGSARRNQAFLFDIEVTIAGMCLSPSP